MRLIDSLSVPMCRGVDHMDFSADGRYAFASCEFSGRMIKVDLQTRRVVATLVIGNGLTSPQDVKLSPDGRTLYTADQQTGGLWEVDPSRFRVTGFLHTGAGAHGLYPSRDASVMYVSNRMAGTISVVSFTTRKVIATWQIPDTRQPGHGRGVRRRTHALAERSLQRRGLRHRHPNGSAACPDPGRIRTTRFVRLASAGALLPRSHRDHALSRARRGQRATEFARP